MLFVNLGSKLLIGQHVLLDALQTATFGLGHKHGDEEDAEETNETEEPESAVCPDTVDEIIKKLGDGETARPIEGRRHGRCVTSDLTGEDLAHHQPRNGSVADGEGDDVNDERSQRQETELADIIIQVLEEEEGAEDGETEAHEEPAHVQQRFPADAIDD